MIRSAFVTITLFTMLACNNNTENSISEEIQTEIRDFSLIGKKGKIIYDNFIAEVSYLSDSSLHWKTTGIKDGKVNEGDEKIFYKRLSENQHFLNWIEADGFVISQIIDTKKMTVDAFGSFSNEQDSGGRTGMLLNGKFEFVN